MHILFLTDNFPPEVNAPASRTFEHCRVWVQAGYKVTVITCTPNFPTGRVFNGYRNRIWQCDEVEGIRVIRVWSYITANEGFVRRILDYMSFMVTASLASLFVRGVDLVVGTSPQFFTACAAYVVSRFKNIPFVFELRDIWPESIKAVGVMKESIVIRMLERLELFLYRNAAQIVSVTQSFKKILISRGVNGDKIVVVTNGVDISRFKPMSKDVELVRKLKLEGKFVAGYVGTHGLAHHLETLLEAAEILRELPCGARFHFILLGDGSRKQALKDMAEKRQLENVTFIDSVPKEQVKNYLSLLDVSVIHLRKTELFKAVIPSKLFESMAMGLPVLHGVAGESANIVREEKVGIVFESENTAELVKYLQFLQNDQLAYQNYRARCLEVAKKYDRGTLAIKMLEAVSKLEKNLCTAKHIHN